MEKVKKRILIDLDGVLNDYGNEKYSENHIPEIKKGVKEFLKEIYENYDLYLFTSRNLLLSAKWLIENDIDRYFKDITNTKIPSFLIIDDRTVCFNGDFDDTLNKIKEFKPHWK